MTRRRSRPLEVIEVVWDTRTGFAKEILSEVVVAHGQWTSVESSISFSVSGPLLFVPLEYFKNGDLLVGFLELFVKCLSFGGLSSRAFVLISTGCPWFSGGAPCFVECEGSEVWMLKRGWYLDWRERVQCCERQLPLR